MKEIIGKAKWGVYSIAIVAILATVIVIIGNSLTVPPENGTELASHDELIHRDAEPQHDEVANEDEPLELAQADPEPKSEPKPVSMPKATPKPVENDDMILASNDRPASTESEEKKDFPKVPDFTLKDLEGEEFTLTENLGKLTILNFWATWCRPCVSEIPDFVELYDEYKDDGLQIVGVSLDEGRSRSRLEPTVDRLKINYPVLADGRPAANLFGGIRSIPTTFIINEKGQVLGQIKGARPKEFFEEVIKKEMLD